MDLWRQATEELENFKHVNVVGSIIHHTNQTVMMSLL